MANEIQFLGMLTVQKNGASVSFPQSVTSQTMAGYNMLQQPQLIPADGAALSLGLIAGAPSKLMLKNLATGSGVSAVAIAAGGAGYSVNDLLVVVGAASGSAAVIKVTAVNGGGAVTAVSIDTIGDYSALPVATQSPTGGTGAGVSLTLTFAVNKVTVYGDAGFTQAQDTLIPGDFIMRSPSSANLYLKPTNSPVLVMVVASEA